MFVDADRDCLTGELIDHRQGSIPGPVCELVGDKIHVSTASEAEWLDNIEELGWKLYLCSSPPYLLQTAVDRRMREYTDEFFPAP